MISGVARWRCKCGVSIKVVTETDGDRIDDGVRVEVTCPKCGHRQVIDAHRVRTITTEESNTAA
jgi:hypothetical protein